MRIFGRDDVIDDWIIFLWLYFWKLYKIFLSEIHSSCAYFYAKSIFWVLANILLMVIFEWTVNISEYPNQEGALDVTI